MKTLRKFRLVCACLNFLGGLLRLVAAFVDMASNYPVTHAAEVAYQVRA